MKRHVYSGLAALTIGSLIASSVGAHSVAQVQTALRIARSTVVAIDPQGRPGAGGVDSDTAVLPGDILSFVIQFTPVPNNATRGAGGYITAYVPENTRVVGARIIDRDGNTVKPHRGPLMNDGYGPKNRHGKFDALGLGQGSMSQLYADTGIFYSTAASTSRVPADTFLSVTNGIELDPVPTGAGQLDGFLGFSGPPFYAHNEWDRIQALAFGVSGGTLGLDGRGNTPFGFGSPVAGSLTHYPFEMPGAPACLDGADNGGGPEIDFPAETGCASGLDDTETTDTDAPVGPWNRIRYWGSETGQGSATDFIGELLRVGVPTDEGRVLNVDSPLPADTTAVRYAVGELVVGQEYFAEISLRVDALPLDPVMGADVVCAEVFGGDAAQPQNGQDNAWRYYVPSPACVQLNLAFDLSVDKLLALPGETLTYRIVGKNLSTIAQQNVVIVDAFDSGDVSFDATLVGPAPAVSNGLLTWPSMNLAPGEEYEFSWQMTVDGGGLSTLNRATYVSDSVVDPGFSVVALTDIESIIVVDLDASVTPLVPATPPRAEPGEVVHYEVLVTNVGTGDATINGNSFVKVLLPEVLSFCSTASCSVATINGSPVTDPSIAGDELTFDSGLSTAAAGGGTLLLSFDALVDGAAPQGLYSIGVETQFRDDGVGRDVENSELLLAPLLVGMGQSLVPQLATPIAAGANAIAGSTDEGAGATVVVFVDGNPVATVTSGAGGSFTASVPTLYAGQRVAASVQAPGEVASERSVEVVVQGLSATFACGDGEDNDGDGLSDFPDDPGCTSASDPDETDPAACADGDDNDGDGLSDFPNDPGCSSYADDDESGGAECADGLDNDGDGLSDFPDDPGCSSASDVSEVTLPQCANGVDDDGDGLVDYPADSDCRGATGSESAVSGDDPATGGGGSPDAGATGGGGDDLFGGVGVLLSNGAPPDLGGVDGPSLSDGSGSGSDGGCGCRVATGAGGAHPWWLIVGLSAMAAIRRRRRARASESR